MSFDSIHKTLLRALIVIWFTGIAIVTVDLFVLDKEHKAWNELKPLSEFSLQNNDNKISALIQTHEKYMQEGVLSETLALTLDKNAPPPEEGILTSSIVADDNTELSKTDDTLVTIEKILQEAKQAELATQIEPAAGNLNNAFIKDEFESHKEQIIQSDEARDVLQVIHDLDHSADYVQNKSSDLQAKLQQTAQETGPEIYKAGDLYAGEHMASHDNMSQDVLPADLPSRQDEPVGYMSAIAAEDKNSDDTAEKSTDASDDNIVPRVVIIIDDMGVTLRSKQVEVMDGPLTLAYLPYASNLPERTQRAIKNGHELMVHMPMEALNRKLDGGPRVLRTNTDEATFIDTLNWGLSQFEGFVGINNHMGSRLTRDEVSMKRLMAHLKGRGLYFIDSKTIGSSVAAKTAKEYGIPYAIRDVFLDHEISAEFVEKALLKLEDKARKKGHAIAIGHPHKVTIEALKKWLPTLEEKGIKLVPASDVIIGGTAQKAQGLSAQNTN